MKKITLIAVPVLAVALMAVAVHADSNQTANTTQNITQDQKNLLIQILELRLQAINDKLSYLKGEITLDQLKASLNTAMQSMSQLKTQFKDMLKSDTSKGKHLGWMIGRRMGIVGMKGFGHWD
jgi:outer membrane protease